MFPRALKVLTIRGVEVRLDPTWLVIALLVVWSFLARWSGGGRPGTVALAMALGAATGFFGSVLAHELGHAFEARHRDLEVHGITLFLFGGVTEMDMHTRRPRDEFTVAAIGPWISLVLAALFGLVTAALDWYLPGRFLELAQVTGTLGWVNLGLALFNIVPGAPLDGGRVLRATLWAVTGDRYRAQMIASRAGQVVAMAVWAFGIWIVLRNPDGLLGALWFGVIGFFMFNAARAERAQAATLRLVDGHTASFIAEAAGPTVPADLPLDRVDLALEAAPGAHLLVGADGDLVGVLARDAVGDVDPHDRTIRTAADVMVPLDQVPTTPADMPIVDVLGRLQEHPVLAVVDGDVIVGLVDRERSEDALRRLQRLRHERRTTEAAGA